VRNILYLRSGHGKANFTTRPHLTLSINRDECSSVIDDPKSVRGRCAEACPPWESRG
jgi:hypothetical protein